MIALWVAAGLMLALVAAWGTALVRRWALRNGVIDVPNARSSHGRPVARGGGVAIVAVTLLTVLAFPVHTSARSFTFTAAALLIALISFYDDVRGLDARTRLVAHGLIAAGFLAIVRWWPAADLPFAPGLELGWVGAVLAFCWLVGLTNAFNFMDGIDGLAGLQAVIAGGAWIVIGCQADAPVVAAAGLGAAAGSLGFLRLNWAPASIFMGDVGSAFLGFTFAALPLLASQESVATALLPRLPLAGMLVVWPFMYDALRTFVRRLARGDNVLTAHREHIYQRLVSGGMTHRSVATFYGGVAVICAFAAVAWTQRIGGADEGAVAALLLVVGLLEGALVLRGVRRRAGADVDPGPMSPG